MNSEQKLKLMEPAVWVPSVLVWGVGACMTHEAMEEAGAQCSKCYLREHGDGPVGLEAHVGSVATIITDYPTPDDIEHGRPLVGSPGQFLLNHARVHNYGRPHFSWTCAVACRPPAGDYDKVLRKLRIINKDRAKRKEPPLPTPSQCCRPRLLRDLQSADNALPLGNLALSSVLGHDASASKLRGAPLEYTRESQNRPPLKVVPLLHPSFVQKAARFTRAFQVDIRRAVKYFTGSGEWVEPVHYYQPTPQFLRDWFTHNQLVAFDFETTRAGQLRAQVYCLSFSNGSDAINVMFLSKETHTRCYAEYDEVEIKKIIREAMIDSKRRWIGHNSRIFDASVSERFFGVTPTSHTDTIMLHRSVESELPHKLEYVGSVWTAIDRAWKATHAGTDATSDRELNEYCNLDAAITFRIYEPLKQAVLARQQAHVVQQDLKLQDVCRGMHANGLLVDMKRRAEWDAKLRRQVIEHKKACRELSGDSKFNPASTSQVIDLLYDKWGLPVLEKTSTDQPSTAEEALLALRFTAGLTKTQQQFMDALRLCRRRASARGTRLARLWQRDKGPVVLDEDALGYHASDKEWAEAKLFETKDAEKEGLLLDDGRFHPSWMPHSTPTGRFGAQLVQNWPRWMRDLFIAAPGHVLISLDADQGELRWGANLSDAKLYKKVLLEGGDPHTLNGLLVFGDEGRKLYETALLRVKADSRYSKYSEQKLIKQARKDDPDWSRACDFAKQFFFASQYKAKVPTIWATLRAAENDKEELINPGLKLSVVQNRYKTWIEQVPEYAAWWQNDLDEYDSCGYLLSPLLGRRRDFADGRNENEIANYRCQCLTADTRVMTDKGLVRIADLSGQKFMAWTGKRWASATAFQKDTVPTFKVRLDRGVEFECDATHKVLVAGEKGFEWTEIHKAVGKTIALDLAEAREFGTKEDAEDAYWLGLWFADGSTYCKGDTRDTDLRWTIADSKGTVQQRGGLEKVEALLRWLPSQGLMGRTYHKQNHATDVYVTSGGRTWLATWGISVDVRSGTKRIPDRIWEADLAARQAFLRGYLDGDGCYLRRLNRVQVVSCQRELLQDVWLLARSCGINGTNLSGPYSVAGYSSYRLDMPAHHCWKMLGWGQDGHRIYTTEQIPAWLAQHLLPHLSKATDSWRSTHSKIRRGGSTSPYIARAMGAPWMYDFAVIESSEPTGRTEPVYTLSVDDPDHQYVAAGVIAKNSGLADVVNAGTLKLVDRVPFNGKYGPGLICQVHDALLFEVRQEYAEEVLGIMRECLYCVAPGYEIPFTFSGKLGLKQGDPISRWNYTE